MQYCPLCDASYADDVSACPLDGARLSAAPAGDTLLGQVIKGRYRVLRKLGEGAMGAVYLAEQLSISRKVALKVLHQQFARDREFVQRFHQEAKLAASLSDPRITTVFDFDRADDGSLFIVMEYLEGTLLSEVIDGERPMPVRRAVRLGLQIADGLGAAHTAGVVHRDIKPQNIMVLSPGDSVKLMDFGIARLGHGQDAAHLTRAGMLIGTPNYMAPEQIEGRPVSAKTDIYAFGVVLYEMLAGKPPFSGPTSIAVLGKQLREPPPPLRSVRPEAPPLLEQVVMQALEKQPESRQPSMADVARRLRIAAGGTAHAERPASPTAPGRLTPSAWTSTAVALALLVAAGTVVVLLHGGRTLSPASTASPRVRQSAPTASPPEPAPATVAQTRPLRRDPVAIQAAVEAKLRDAGLLRTQGADDRGVTVEAIDPDGVVRLSGVVRSADERDAVLRLTRSVSGVNGVVSRVNVPWTSQ